jgi:hypothetical protein
MTFRELLKTADLDKTYQHINDKDNSYVRKTPILLSTTSLAYSKVVKELLSKKKTNPFKYKIFVDESEDWYDKQKYIQVSLLNPRYVEPPAGLKPWGGGPGQKIPEGYYNCNAVKHNRLFAFGPVKWSEIIDTPVINNIKYSNEKILAEILWELTFYGWTEKKVNNTLNNITKSINRSKKEVEEGKCIEILPKKEGGKKIIIPDSVIKQLENISGGPIDFQNL